METRARLLKYVEKWPGCMIGELADMMQTDRPNLSRMIKGLEKKGILIVKEVPVRGSRVIGKKIFMAEKK